MPKFKLEVKVEIRDKNGKVIRTIKKPCKSYVRQMVHLLRCQMSAGATTTKDTGGTDRSLSPDSLTFKVVASVGTVTYGIRVGKSNSAVAVEQNALLDPILEGTTAGKLAHLATTVGAVSVVGSTAQFTIARTMTGNPIDDVTVKEVGLYALGASWYFMVERSLLEFTVAKGESGTVTYTISVTA